MLVRPRSASPAVLDRHWPRQLERRIPDAQAAARPDQIARVSGDLLDLHDLPWSSGGTPDPSGTIVIEDVTATILGVYPPF